jgi:DNA-binding transcriptional LysR family regulator
MNYNYLLYFSVLAEVEHYTQAASRLGISQPSLSSAIHNLENDLGGVKLFEKVGRNIRLTDQGRFYQSKVDAALKELHSASRILKDSKDDAPLVIRLGLVSGTLNGRVAEEITKYTADNKRIRFQITESSAENLMSLLRKEKLDMAIVDSTSRDPSFHFRILCKRDYYIAFHKDHPLANREFVSPEEVISLPQVVFNYDVGNSFQQWANGSAMDENVICQVNTAQAALDMVDSGIGIAFIPDSCICPRENVRYVLLKNWHQAIYMCILYDKWLEPSIWKFRENVMSALQK